MEEQYLVEFLTKMSSNFLLEFLNSIDKEWSKILTEFEDNNSFNSAKTLMIHSLGNKLCYTGLITHCSLYMDPIQDVSLTHRKELAVNLFKLIDNNKDTLVKAIKDILRLPSNFNG